MAAINEQIVIGRAFRKLIDQANNIWMKISFWTKASDVEFNDGKTAETKVGGINGITSDVKRSDDDIASSILPVHNIKSNLDQGIINDKIQLDVDEDGDLVWKSGADSVLKKLGSGIYDITITLYVSACKHISWGSRTEFSGVNFPVKIRVDCTGHTPNISIISGKQNDTYAYDINGNHISVNDGNASSANWKLPDDVYGSWTYATYNIKSISITKVK